MNIIETSRLTHIFQDRTVGIEEVSFTVKKGSFIVLAGKNGSGKTTLCRHFNGLLRPTSGDIHVRGIDVKRRPSEARQYVGMVFQNPDSGIVGETVYGDIAFGPENLRLAPTEIESRVLEALAAVGLEAKRNHSPYLLSGGEKRRLAIAGVLAMKPEIIVFDEPFTNLDFPGARQVLQQILLLHSLGHTIILVTHDLEKVAAYADRLVVMREGKIAEDGPPELVVPSVEAHGVREPCSSRMGKGLLPWLD